MDHDHSSTLLVAPGSDAPAALRVLADPMSSPALRAVWALRLAATLIDVWALGEPGTPLAPDTVRNVVRDGLS